MPAQQSPAQKYFDLGAHALEVGNTTEATKAFSLAVSTDSSMCDAYVGLLALGDTSPGVASGVLRSIRNYAGEFRRTGLPQFKVVIPFVLDVFQLSMPTNNRADLAIGCAALLIDAGDVKHRGEAAKILIDVRKDLRTSGKQATSSNYARYVWLCLLAAAERWPEVLAADTDPNDDWDRNDVPDSLQVWMLGYAALRARALVGIGSNDEAASSVDVALRDESMKAIHQSLVVTQGYAMRAMGRTDDADRIFKAMRAYSSRRDLEHAIANPDYTLPVVTTESLQTRSDPWDPSTGTTAAQIDAATRDADREEYLERAWAQLDALIGSPDVKAQIRRLASKVKATKRKIELAQQLGRDFDAEELRLSSIISGPPGTGKTTGVRILKDLYYGLGVIDRPELYEHQPSDLMTGFVGQAGKHTNKLIDESRGGLFFLDEAYGLVSGDGDEQTSAYGREALEVCLARIENEGNKPLPEKVVMIFAGYEDDMNRLLQVNAGLPLRFPTRIPFNSFTADELVLIAKSVADSRRESISDAGQTYLENANEMLACIRATDRKGRVVSGIDLMSNARFMRTVIESAQGFRDMRIESIDSTTLTAEEEWDLRGRLEIDDVRAAYEETLRVSPIFPWAEWDRLSAQLALEDGSVIDAEIVDPASSTGTGIVVDALMARTEVENG